MWGTVSEGTVNLPPLLIVPGVVGNDLPYNFEIFEKYEVVLYFLTLSLTQWKYIFIATLD